MSKSKSSSHNRIQCLEHLNDPQQPWVFLFHGFGASSSDLESLKDILSPASLPPDQKLNWVFPNGIFEVPIGIGWTGRAWWPLRLSSLPTDWSDYSPDNMTSLVTQVTQMIEGYGAKWNNVILGGFSQGSMLATEIYLQAPETPKGLISFSGSLIRKSIWAEKMKSRRGEKVFLSHGEQDDVLPSGGTHKLIQLFKQNEIDCDFVSFRGGHEIPFQVITRAQKYISEKVKPL